MDKYTEEQIADIREREETALTTLKQLHLTPAAMMTKVSIGTNGAEIFADQVIPYLRDTKYAPTVSPLSEEVKKDA